MATIIRPARVTREPVTLAVPAANSSRSDATGGGVDVAVQPGMMCDAVKQESEEVRVLTAQLRETEAALRRAQLYAESLADEQKSKAYGEGLAMGREAGKQAGLAEFAERVEALDRLIDSARLLERQALESAEDKAVEIVMEAVCKIIGEFLASEPATLVTVREALVQANGAKISRVRVSPRDYRVITETNAFEGIAFFADETIEIGGCVLESDAGALDYRLDMRLEQLKALLLTVRGGDEFRRSGVETPSS